MAENEISKFLRARGIAALDAVVFIMLWMGLERVFAADAPPSGGKGVSPPMNVLDLALRWVPPFALIGTAWLYGRWRGRKTVEGALAEKWTTDKRLTAIAVAAWRSHPFTALVHPKDQKLQAFVACTNWAPYSVVVEVSGMSFRASTKTVCEIAFAKHKTLVLGADGAEEAINVSCDLLPATWAVLMEHDTTLPLDVQLHAHAHVEVHGLHGPIPHNLSFKVMLATISEKADFEVGPDLDWPDDGDKLSA